MKRFLKVLFFALLAFCVIWAIFALWGVLKFWLLGASTLITFVLSLNFFKRIPRGQDIEEKVKLGAIATTLVVISLFSGIFAYQARPKLNLSAPAPQVLVENNVVDSSAYPTFTPLAEAPTQTPVRATPVVVADLSFVATVPDCQSVNGPWKEAFAKGLTYEVKPGQAGLPTDDTFVFFEGVLADSSPKDLHSVFEVKKAFNAEQGNFWVCPGKLTDSQKYTILFQSADKKWQNLDSQKLAHPMAITDPHFQVWMYASGEKPAWALSKTDTNMVCPFKDTPIRQDPAGVILPDGAFVGAPGKAGCDFVIISPDGKAIRYTGAIDNFRYESGSRFFLFDPQWSNENLAKALNLAKVKYPG